MRVIPEDVYNPKSYEKVRLPLDDAETLPAWCYTSEAFWRAEVDHIFMKVWNFMGRVDLIPKPGDYYAVNFAGVPVVIVRDEKGEVRAFANTCRHRGARIADGKGNTRAFKCPYHAWVYGLDGRLKGAAGMENTKGFDRANYGLVPIRLETWGGYIFINFDDKAESLANYLGDLPEELASYNCEDLVTTRVTEYDLKCNWKLFIENAMEEYHLPTVHKASLQLLEMKHGIVPVRGNWDVIREKHEGTRALLDEDREHALPRIKSLTGHPAEGTHYVVLYPSTMLGMTTDCVWWLELRPDGPHKTKLIVGTSFPKETVARGDFADKVKYYYKRWDRSVGEDNDISEIQHEGVNSPFAVSGRLSHLEPLVHHIANWVADRIVGGDTFDRRHDADKTSAIALSLTKSGGGGRRPAAAE